MIIHFIIILIILYFLLKDSNNNLQNYEEESVEELDEEKDYILDEIDELKLSEADEKCRLNMPQLIKTKCNNLTTKFNKSLTNDEMNLLYYFENFNQIFTALHKNFPLEKFIKNFGNNKKEYLQNRIKVKKVLQKLLSIFTPEDLVSCCEIGEIINTDDYLYQ